MHTPSVADTGSVAASEKRSMLEIDLLLEIYF